MTAVSLRRGVKVTSSIAAKLERLLRDSSYLDLLMRDRWVELGVSDGERKALERIDRHELSAAAQAIRRDLLGPRGANLGDTYARSLAALAELGHTREEVADDFVASPWYERYREIPHAGPGLCSQEAFYRFLAETTIGVVGPLAATLRHEFLTSLFQSLTVSARPSFEIPRDVVKQRGRLCWHVERYPTNAAREVMARLEPDQDRWLYAAAPVGFVSGPVNGLVEDLIAIGDAGSAKGSAAALAATHGVHERDVADAVEALLHLALLEQT